MARNGSGTFSLPQAPFVTNTTISSTATNSNNSDIAAALTQSISKDGQTAYTGNQPMGGNKLTGLGVGTATTDSAAMSQLYGVPVYGGVGGGTVDVITITPSPGVTAYAIGQRFSFKALGANTGATTLNVNSVGAGAVTWADGTALVAGDIPSGAMIEVEVQAATPVFHIVSATKRTAGTPINQSSTGPTTQNLTSGTGATYTTPAGVKWIKIRAIGGGGGGGGTGSTLSPTGATGGTTTFNSVNAVGGSGGTGVGAALGTVGGAGGTGGTGTATRRSPGSAGQANSPNASTATGGPGGASLFGGLGTNTGGGSASVGGSAAANSGSGGNGATGTAGATNGGAGGGAGEYYELIIVNPSATYTYTIGGGGAGGIGTGSNIATGGAGGSGFITVEEHYNL